MDTQTLIEQLQIEQLGPVLLAAVVSLWLLRRITRFLDGLAERFTNYRMALKRLSVLLQFTIYLTLFYAVTSSLVDAENKEALYAIFGALGLAAGFAFKDLLASIVAGIVLLADEPFRVGDKVVFDGDRGEIVRIGLRSVRLLTSDKHLVTIPNARFLTDSVHSLTAGGLHSMMVIPFYIAAAEDFKTAQRIITEAAWTSRYAFPKKPVVTLVADEFLGERFVTVIRVKAWVYDARYESLFVSDVTERVKLALAEAGIRGPDRAYRDLEVRHGVETMG